MSTEATEAASGSAISVVKPDADVEADSKVEEAWYQALYEEDSLRLMDLLRENSRLELWKRGWDRQSYRLVGGRPDNYWVTPTRSSWMGRTALHVGARRGCVRLLQQVLKLCSGQGKQTRWRLSNLLLAKDGYYTLDAIAMAVVNGNRDVVATLLEAGLQCDFVKRKYGIRQAGDNKNEENLNLNLDKENRRHREELITITEEFIEKLKKEPQVRDIVLGRYKLHRDFNFLPQEVYLFHFLFTRFENANIGLRSVNGSLAGRINVLLVADMVEAIKSSSSSPKLLDFLWELQDGQGRPPFHVAAEEEWNPLVLRCKALTLTRTALKVGEETLKRALRARDGTGRTAVHRAVALGDAQDTLGSLLRLENGKESSLQDKKLTGLLKEIASKFPPNEFDNMKMEVAAAAVRDSLEIKEVDVDTKSSWRSSGGIGYSIDLHRLAKNNAFSEHLWSGCMPIHSAILHKNIGVCSKIVEVSRLERLFTHIELKERHSVQETPSDQDKSPAIDQKLCKFRRKRSTKSLDPLRVDTLRLAAVGGDPTVLKKMLSCRDEHTGKAARQYPWGAAHLTAALGKYECMKTLAGRGLDPSEEDHAGNTPLHYAVQGTRILGAKRAIFDAGVGLLDYANCTQFRKDEEAAEGTSSPSVSTGEAPEAAKSGTLDENFDERKQCIELLIVLGANIFQSNREEQIPTPLTVASSQFLSWWHTAQVKEFGRVQDAQNVAANAISVTAALVATASYVGPLTPPLGYSDEDPTQVRLELLAVRIFILCDTLSFYLAISAIIFALVPCLPRPQQSMREELRRTRRMVIIAVNLLLPAMICVLVAFAAGSTAVIQTEKTTWNRGGITIGTASVGGFICLIAVVTFFMRVLTISVSSEKAKSVYSKTL